MLALLLLHLLMGHRYAAVWQSDVTLWRWAMTQAPHRLRPWLNYQKASAASSDPWRSPR